MSPDYDFFSRSEIMMAPSMNILYSFQDVIIKHRELKSILAPFNILGKQLYICLVYVNVGIVIGIEKTKLPFKL